MGPSLLIVDDEVNFLVLLDRIFSRDYRVTVARGTDCAIHLLDREIFDLAILDVKMYPMDGVELLTQIIRRSPSTQVVMVTAYPTDDSRYECVKLGAAGYLTKPIEISELKAVLRLVAGAQG
jgi:two-component system, response regulator RegA